MRVLDSRRVLVFAPLRKRLARSLTVAALAAVLIAACGASGGNTSGQATALLRETFGGSHPVNSGVLHLELAVKPSGSQTLNGPIALRFGGPFQGLGNGRPPRSDFTITLSALGRTGSLGVLSTGTKGYVTLDGTAYQLPAATFRRLEASLSGLTSSSRSRSSSGLLGKLGVSPLRWLNNPTVVGTQTIDGANTTHIYAGINVAKLLVDLNAVLHRTSSLGISGANRVTSGISSSARARIARNVHNPTIDVWTGSTDHTLRRLDVNLGLPVSGSSSTLLGGVRAAQLALVMQYSHINQPQTITAPASSKPFSQFASKLQELLQGLQGTLAGATLSNGSGSSGGSTSGQLQRYSQCIQSAGGDVAKMQRCAGILNGG